MASIGTCAGIYVLSFLEQRGISTEGAGVNLSSERDPETKLVSKITLELRLPPGFPEKYRGAVIREAEQCAVEHHLDNSPAFETYVTLG